MDKYEVSVAAENPWCRPLACLLLWHSHLLQPRQAGRLHHRCDYTISEIALAARERKDRKE